MQIDHSLFLFKCKHLIANYRISSPRQITGFMKVLGMKMSAIFSTFVNLKMVFQFPKYFSHVSLELSLLLKHLPSFVSRKNDD